MAALAAQLTAHARSPLERVEAVVAWLRATHGYTLRLPRPTPGQDPVESFLFETPEGHCEYFASATALLLRGAGVPTRYVNGYLGGEWNDVGHYVAVRDNRAHSWVEAYLPTVGWVRVDATPPLPLTARAARLGQLLDALDFKWSRWVVGYDLSRQLELGRRVAGRLGLHGPEPRGERGRVPAWLLVLVAVGSVALAASRVWPARAARAGAPRRPAPSSGAPVHRLYARALARLARAGLPRHGAETPREYAARVAGRRPRRRRRARRAHRSSTRRRASAAGPSTREALRRLARGLALAGPDGRDGRGALAPRAPCARMRACPAARLATLHAPVRQRDTSSAKAAGRRSGPPARHPPLQPSSPGFIMSSLPASSSPPLTAALGLLACLAFARPASAQLGTAGTLGTTTTTAATLADGDIFIGIQATEGANLTDFDLARFFNKDNCDCDTPVYGFVTLTASGLAKRTAVPDGERVVLGRVVVQRP